MQVNRRLPLFNIARIEIKTSKIRQKTIPEYELYAALIFSFANVILSAEKFIRQLTPTPKQKTNRKNNEHIS